VQPLSTVLARSAWMRPLSLSSAVVVEVRMISP
jgi:hypothetical protein